MASSCGICYCCNSSPLCSRCSRARKVHYARTIQLAYRKHLRQKYQMSMKECVEATMERRLGKLITKKRTGSDAAGVLGEEPGALLEANQGSQEGGGPRQVKFDAVSTD